MKNDKMMREVKCETLKGVSRIEVAKVMRDRYPLMKIISARYELNFLDLAKVDRIPEERIMKVYFIEDVDMLIEEFEKLEEDNGESK